MLTENAASIEPGMAPLGKTDWQEVAEALTANNPVFARYFEHAPANASAYCTKIARELNMHAEYPGTALMFHARSVYPPNQSLSHAFIAAVERRDGALTFTWLHQECIPDLHKTGEMIAYYFDTIDTSFMFNGKPGPLEAAIMQSGLPDVNITPALAPGRLKEFQEMTRDVKVKDRYQSVVHPYGHFSTPEKPYIECYGTSNAVLTAMEKGNDFALGMDIRPLFPTIFLDMAKQAHRLGRTPLDRIRTVTWIDKKTGEKKIRDLEDDMPRDEQKRVLVTVATRSGVTPEGKPWHVEAIQHQRQSKF
jgi:hypothetical protein